RAGDDFFVERPQVLEAAAAAADDQNVGGLPFVHRVDRRGDLARGGVALNGHRKNTDMRRIETASDHVENIAKRRAVDRRDDADTSRQKRQLSFSRDVEKSLGFEFFLHLLETKLQRAETLGLHALDIKLVLTALRINRNPSVSQHFQAVLGLKRKRAAF